MEISVVRAFFMWCTILNGGLLIFSAIICAFAGDWVYRAHSRWFPMSREAFNVVIYSFIGFYKVLFLLFNLVSYLALAILD